MTHVEHVPAGNPLIVAHRLDAVAWGLFFVWVGIALIAGFGWGLGLLRARASAQRSAESDRVASGARVANAFRRRRRPRGRPLG